MKGTSHLWPNPAFDNNLTVYGPDVKALAGRYLAQSERSGCDGVRDETCARG